MKTLRKRLIIAVLLSTICVFALTVVGVNIFMCNKVDLEADQKTSLIATNGGKMPRFSDFMPQNHDFLPFIGGYMMNEESEFQTRYFVVFLDDEGRNVESNMSNIAAIDNNKAEIMTQQVMKRAESVGYCNDFRFRKSLDSPRPEVIFLDTREDFKDVENATFVICIVAVIITAILTIVFSFASVRVIKPFEENQKRQKQFITDAGHELKTPLAIISANAEVLEYKAQDMNEWTSAIKNQVKNLNKLISQLLVLSKSDEIDPNMLKENVNLSNLVFDSLKDFEEIFINKKCKIETKVDSDIMYSVNIENIKRLISILLDNASKYIPEKGELIVELKKQVRGVTFIVANTDINNQKIDCERLFDRFYRTDSSRNSETGGHGIGLSIAKRICEQHGGSISARQENNLMIFEARF